MTEQPPGLPPLVPAQPGPEDAAGESPGAGSLGGESPGGENADSDRYIEALIADYESLRSSFERVDQNGAALLAIAVTIATGVGAFLVHSCHGPSLSCTPEVWPPLYAFLPALPFIMILLFADLGNAKTLRMFYTRALEQELQRVTRSPEVYFAGGKAIQFPAYGHISVGIFGQHRGKPRYRFSILFVYVSVAVLFLSVTALSLCLARPVDLQVIMGAVYLFTVIVVLRLAWLGGRGARRLWHEATLPGSWRTDPAAAAGPGRSIRSYLLVPRPHELFVRAWIIPVAWVFAAISTHSVSARQLGWTAAATAIFELFFYQARYIINDLRSLQTDAGYSDYKKLNRFPSPARPAWVRYALLVIIARAGLGAWACWRLLPWHDGSAVLAGAAALAVQCAVYEAERAKASSRTGRGLPYLTPGRAAIYLTVGLGYLIRAWVGFGLGGLAAAPALTIVLLSAAILAFGTMSVTMAWALSCVTQVVPPARAAWPGTRYRPSLLQYTHLGPLASQAGLLARDAELSCEPAGAEEAGRAGVAGDLHRWRLLRGNGRLTWWNVAALGYAGSLAGAAVAVYDHAAPRALAVAGLAGAVMQAVTLAGYAPLARRAGRGPRVLRLVMERGIVLVPPGAAAVFAACLAVLPPGPALTAAAGFAFASASYFYFRDATLDDMEVTFAGLYRSAGTLARRAGSLVMTHLIGGYATRLLFAPPDDERPAPGLAESGLPGQGLAGQGLPGRELAGRGLARPESAEPEPPAA